MSGSKGSTSSTNQRRRALSSIIGDQDERTGQSRNSHGFVFFRLGVQRDHLQWPEDRRPAGANRRRFRISRTATLRARVNRARSGHGGRIELRRSLFSMRILDTDRNHPKIVPLRPLD